MTHRVMRGCDWIYRFRVILNNLTIPPSSLECGPKVNMEQKIETRIETHVNRTGKWVRVHQRGRQDVDDLKNVLVTGNTGTQVPLNEIASIQMVMGPSMISSENGLLRGTVLMKFVVVTSADL